VVEDEEPGLRGGEARGGGGLGKGALAMSVAPPSGQNRIMTGPKSDGTYVVEFKTAVGEALAISIPRTEAAVIRHFLRIARQMLVDPFS
jgi:hypothetical protein